MRRMTGVETNRPVTKGHRWLRRTHPATVSGDTDPRIIVDCNRMLAIRPIGTPSCGETLSGMRNAFFRSE